MSNDFHLKLVYSFGGWWFTVTGRVDNEPFHDFLAWCRVRELQMVTLGEPGSLLTLCSKAISDDDAMEMRIIFGAQYVIRGKNRAAYDAALAQRQADQDVRELPHRQ